MARRTTHYDKRVLKQLLRRAPGEVEDWWAGNAQEMADDVKLMFGSSPPGEAYKRGSRMHVASRPGYPPNVDTGALRASIRAVSKARLTFVVTDGVEHGLMLERGTSDMQARPFLAPVIHNWRQRKLAERVNDLREKLRHV